jgi:hypothetical protein
MMASEHDLIKGDTMIEHIKEWAPFVGAPVAMIAGWWAWRTSYLKALSDRVTHLEGKLEALTVQAAAERLRVAELTAERIGLLAQLAAKGRELEEARADGVKWRTRWEARRARQRQDSQRTGLEEDTSDGDALDDLAADSSCSGLIHAPPGGMPK